MTIEELKQQAISELATDGELVPTLVAQGTSSAVVIPLTEVFATDGDKQRHLRTIGRQLRTRPMIGALQVLWFYSEATIRASKGDTSPTDVVLLHRFELASRRTEFTMLEILRGEGGEISLSTYFIPEGTQVIGPLIADVLSGYEQPAA